jgi:hypothetical protein
VYFPELQGLVLLNRGDLYKLSDVTKEWGEIAPGSRTTSYHSFAEYNPVHKVVVFGGGNDSNRNFYLLNSSGQVTALNTPPVNLEVPRVEFTHDPVTGDYLVFNHSKTFYTYNVLTDTWASRSISGVPAAIWETSDPSQFNTLAAPISTHGVVLFVNCKNTSCRAYLYKHAQVNNSDTTSPARPAGLRIR